MQKNEYDKIVEILSREPFLVRKRLEEFIRTIKIESPLNEVGNRTSQQTKSLFLWYGMIEKIAENEGITWNEVVGKTHQLKITTEGLHVMGKQLQKALWGTDSTKQLKKTGQIDILIDHFVDLFSKVGLELPPFPSSTEKESTLENIEMAKQMDYPEDIYNGELPTI